MILPRAARMLASSALVLALGACGPKTVLTGVIDAPPGSDGQPDPRRTALVQPDGQRHRLALSGDSLWLADLGGCSVQLEAQQVGMRLRVARWLVTDAGDGSQPYIGVLERTGLTHQLRDRQTGSAFVLVEDSVPPALQEHAGQAVLVVGFIAGPNRLRVVSWHPLRPLPTE